MPKLALVRLYALALPASSLKSENTEGAIADLDKATSLKPEHPKAHEFFGDALLKAGKEAEAALQWRIAEELKKALSARGSTPGDDNKRGT